MGDLPASYLDAYRYEYGRRRGLDFARERDAHAGDLHAWQLPAFV